MTVQVSIGTSCLTRDLVWCECRRGISLTGNWLYCPNCGGEIYQESYLDARDQAKKNGATIYRMVEEVENIIRLNDALVQIGLLATGWKHGNEGVHLLKIEDISRKALESK